MTHPGVRMSQEIKTDCVFPWGISVWETLSMGIAAPSYSALRSRNAVFRRRTSSDHLREDGGPLVSLAAPSRARAMPRCSCLSLVTSDILHHGRYGLQVENFAALRLSGWTSQSREAIRCRSIALADQIWKHVCMYVVVVSASGAFGSRHGRVSDSPWLKAGDGTTARLAGLRITSCLCRQN